MTTAINPVPFSTRAPLWRIAGGIGLALTAVLLGGLALRPTAALHVLWDMVIPLLPMVFLANPLIWRNVCPLATLNAAAGIRVGRRIPDPSWLQHAWVIGVVLLAVMVPARRFLFNENGSVLLGAIVAVAGLALLLGAGFSRRSGFCNALCPVLPVEKLYGQAPLIRVPTARCVACNKCSAIGCIELAGNKSLPQSLGRARRNWSWTLAPLGIFAGSFPGFVIGYFTTTNGPAGSALAVYSHVGQWTLASFGVTLAIVGAFRLRAARVLPVLGGIAAGLYYWFAGPGIAEAYGLPGEGATLLRIATLGFVGYWLLRSLGLAGSRSQSHV
jgi:hypothetical protein